MKLVIFFLFLSISLLSQNSKYKVSLGSHYLLTTDLTIQKPDGENSFKCITPSSYPSFEIQINFPLTHLFQFETGYRFKQHPIAYKNKYLLFSQWIETTHSIPLRIGVISGLKNQGFLKRFSIAFSGGILFDFMQQSESSPLVTSQQFQLQTSTGVYKFKDDYNPNEVNQVKFSISLNCQAQISYRVYKFINIYLGYGYTQGTRKLAKGNYTIQDPSGFINSGSMFTKGTYRYTMLGFSFHFYK